MPRPKKYGCIKCKPDANYFKPRGIPLVDLEEISLKAARAVWFSGKVGKARNEQADERFK